ncbi:hypothetical protein A9R01_10745 ['Osedax' symbiont bacterium Rs2_46_30_T18]|nr:hypothetical protein A9R01_10745 ['Osedax' symbiont bacterium Rs2_46_30_T18]
MKIKGLISGLILLLTVSVPVMADWQQAADEVEQSIEEMLAKVSPYRGDVDADLEPLYLALAQVTQDTVDYPYIAKIVMGKYYRRASAQDKLDFAQVFRRTLIKTYAKTLVSFNIKAYEVIEPRSVSPKPDKQKVTVKVLSEDGKAYSIVNYMVKTDEQWKLVNIVLDGFNLRVTFKNQFSNIAQNTKGDVSAAIAQWSAKMSKK